jgi:hypothetical protein
MCGIDDMQKDYFVNARDIPDTGKQVPGITGKICWQQHFFKHTWSPQGFFVSTDTVKRPALGLIDAVSLVPEYKFTFCYRCPVWVKKVHEFL